MNRCECNTPRPSAHDAEACTQCSGLIVPPGQTRIDWEWADGSCNYALADSLQDADAHYAWLQQQADRMQTTVSVWIDGQPLGDYPE